MKATDIKAADVFLVAPGRSVLTARRGMAHAGGKITIADVSAETMAGYVKTGKVVVDKEALEARKAAEALAESRRLEAIEAGKERAKVAAAGTGVTEAEIVEAIGKLDPDNPEHWTTGNKPQVVILEGILGKQISAADRDAAWATMPESSN